MNTQSKKMNFLEAESMALNLAYKQFFGEKEPVGIAFTFITDRKAGKAWDETEKSYVKFISQQAISDLKQKNLVAIIESGAVPDCAMARRFMATGSGQTLSGYNF